jgi:hypothetical protein
MGIQSLCYVVGGRFHRRRFSFFATALIEMTTGNFLKKYRLEVKVFGFEFSFTLFFIATVIVRVWLFGV